MPLRPRCCQCALNRVLLCAFACSAASGRIAFNANAATVQAALNAMPNIGTGGVLVTNFVDLHTGDPLVEGFSYDVEFAGQ